jgi:transcriptional regulator with XRE-family HTH domain
LSPEDVGLPNGSSRRRTPGLRREEVAQLAAVSTAWYTALEQAREANASKEVLEGIADALRVSDEERTYLFTLARLAPPPLPDAPPDELPVGLRYLVDGLQASPAFVVGRRCEVLAWNEAASAVFGDFGAMAPEERNMIWLLWTNPGFCRLFVSWECFARDFLAMFRAFSARWVDDPWYAQFVENLKGVSPGFAEWWEVHEVRGVSQKRRMLDHPLAGRFWVEFATLQANGSPDLMLCAFTVAPDSEEADKLRGLVDARAAATTSVM